MRPRYRIAVDMAHCLLAKKYRKYNAYWAVNDGATNKSFIEELIDRKTGNHIGKQSIQQRARWIVAMRHRKDRRVWRNIYG